MLKCIIWLCIKHVINAPWTSLCNGNICNIAIVYFGVWVNSRNIKQNTTVYHVFNVSIIKHITYYRWYGTFSCSGYEFSFKTIPQKMIILILLCLWGPMNDYDSNGYENKSIHLKHWVLISTNEVMIISGIASIQIGINNNNPSIRFLDI